MFTKKYHGSIIKFRYVAYKKAFLGGFMSRKTGVKTKKCLVFQFYRIDNV